MTVKAWPLSWPHGRPRTSQWHRITGKFKTSFAVSMVELQNEVKRLGGRELIISTNLELRLDGYPKASARTPDDRGVSCYFKRNGKDMAFACDKYLKIEDNIHAITLTIGALRGIARWGTGDMMEAAFTGFTALPAPPSGRLWREVFRMEPGYRVTLESAEAAYRGLAQAYHPDRPGGSADKMSELNAARDQMRRELG